MRKEIKKFLISCIVQKYFQEYARGCEKKEAIMVCLKNK